MNNYFWAVMAFTSALSGLVFFSTPTEHFINAFIASAAYISMAISLIFAARSKLLDHVFAGPDKCYLIHRYFGYCAVLFSLLHWARADDALNAVIPAFADSAGDLGEFAIISLLSLISISVLKLIPYQWWKKSHLLMGPLFLLIALHTFFSASPIILLSTFWWILLVLTILATLAWLKTLLFSISPKKARVIAINKEAHVLDLTVELRDSLQWKPGQFAQISVSKSGLNESHPFSFANAPGNNNARFIINQTGDYTSHLYQTIALGDEVSVHHVAGKFTPGLNQSRKRQIWVAAGSGITPFLATLDAMHGDQGPSIELIYNPGKNFATHIVKELMAYQQSLPQFTLVLLNQGEYLSVNHFELLQHDWQCAELYLCGPQSIKLSAQHIWRNHKAKGKIHTELFDFRAAKSFIQIAKLPVINYLKSWIIKILTHKKVITIYHRVINTMNMRSFKSLISPTNIQH